MPDSKSSLGGGGESTAKRSLPPWTSSKQVLGTGHGKKAAGSGQSEVNGEDEESNKGHVRELPSSTLVQEAQSSGTSKFSELLEGVVFALSGFINPERSMLRSQALEMGAEYQPDWNSNCTLLICAFPDTPKFRQVEADNGTIVAKEWVTECYTQRKLVDIESYLMHAGKPWRRRALSNEGRQDAKMSSSGASHKQVEKRLHSRQSTGSASLKKASNLTEDLSIPSKVKSWAVDDLHRTIAWLKSQDEKPPVEEINKIAAEGILTCLQDAIDALEQKQDVRRITEQWQIIPQVVEELIKLEGSGNDVAPISNADLCKKATDCKRIYEVQYSSAEDDSSSKHRKSRNNGQKFSSGKNSAATVGYDSDETIEMTEEEIEHAYNTVASKLPKF